MKNRKIILSALLIASMLIPVKSYASEAESLDEIDVVDDGSAEEDEIVTDDRIIPSGISIEGVDVSGMTVTEADAVVDEYLSKYDDVEFTLSANGQTVTATGSDLSICAKNSDVTGKAATYGSSGNFIERYKASSDLSAGRTKDFSISVGADVAGIIDYLDSVADQVNDDAKDNYVTRVDGEFVYHEGTTGVVVKVSTSAAELVDYIENEWDGQNCSFELTTETKEPRGTEEELSVISDVLGSFSTDYSSSSSSRKNNVANGVSLINGTVLYPGDEFSVLDAITPFTAENGYMLAGSYENGTTVETYGGGICQVSTTFYGAVREAEVEVVTRSCHSMVVNYVQPSQDAAISESGSKDFQIKNNKSYPIYIEGYCSGGKVYFTIYGKEEREATHKVSYETEITGVAIQNTTWVADPNVPIGVMTTTVSGHTGYTARLWKIITENGEEVSRNVYNNSTYNPSNRTVTVGIASTDAVASQAMLNAIASQDVNQIATAISTYAPGVVNSTPYIITPKYTVTNAEEETTEETTDATAAESPVNETTGESTDGSTVNETTGEAAAQ